MRLTKTGTIDHFTIRVFDVDGVTPKTGLVNGDFSKFLVHDGVFVSQGTVAVTVTEVDSVNAAGAYDVSCTKPSDGYWLTYLTQATYAPTGFEDESIATPAGAGALDALISSRADGGIFTAGRGANLDNLDVAVSTRADGAAYTGARAAKIDHLDVDVSSRADGASYTGARAAKIDSLDVAVSTRADGSAYTGARATKLDHLDADVSSRAAPGAAMSLSAAAVDAGQITAAAANKLADHKIRRTFANARASANGDAPDKRSELGALCQLANKHAIVGSQLLIFQEDDVTEFYRQNLVGNSGATPVISATPV